MSASNKPSAGHNNPPALLPEEFSVRVATAKATILRAMDKTAAANLARGSATQIAAMALITHHETLTLHGDKPAAWADLLAGGEASTNFRTDFLNDVLKMPTKPEGFADWSLNAKKDHNDKRKAATALLIEALKVACAIMSHGITAMEVCTLNNKGLLTLPVGWLLPAGTELSQDYHSKLTAVTLDGKSLMCIRKNKDGENVSARVYCDPKHLIAASKGDSVSRKTRGAKSNQNNAGETAKPDLAKAMHASSTKDIFEALPKPVREQVLAHADIETMVAAVRRQLCAPDAAPITKATYSAQMLKDLARIAEYYNGNVAPVMLAA